MERQHTISWLGACIAVITAIALVLSGWPWPITAAVLLVWLCSLWLSRARAPVADKKETPSPFAKGNMEAVLELSDSPQLLTDRGKVVVANEAARQAVGTHTIGQDARIAFRHPEAVDLLNSVESGGCTIRNFARPQDCWQMRRQIISADLALIELTDRTAEVLVGRAHTDFVANASHELRTPLAAIVGYVETLKEGSATIDPVVSDLMSLSRIEAEKHDAPATPVPLAQIARHAALEAAGPERTARIDLHLDGQAMVAGDIPQLEQLVRNLVDNALKYGNETERVKVSVRTLDSRYAQLEVVDQGAGISKEHLPHLTRRFYRTDPGRSRGSGGTGLGLAIVKHIVERHRGKLDISSELGHGTRVVIRLPLLAPGSNEESRDNGQAITAKRTAQA